MQRGTGFAFVTANDFVGTTGMVTASGLDLLVVDGDEQYRTALAARLRRQGVNVQEVPTGADVLRCTEQRAFDLIILALTMPDVPVLELVEKLKAGQPDCAVVVLDDQPLIDSAVQAMKRGASDYLPKSLALDDLEVALGKACERRRLHKENAQLKLLLQQNATPANIVGRSAAMQEVFRVIERAGPSDKAILIQGESGTGKELVAQALHGASTRRHHPLVTINCAALPAALLESQLFGHERGAFTDAVADAPGLIEVADGGTLFIDEIGELPLALQAKLLRVLEDGSLRRVGSVKERRVNVRLLVATNRDLASEMSAGHFREDLYYRINVLSLHLPPLRERQGDVPLLVEHFLGAEWKVDPAAMQLLEAYRWPGNVRQLSNAIARAKILSDDHTVRVSDLPREVAANTPAPAAPRTDVDDLSTLERMKVQQVLQRERGNKTRAARVLGIDRRKLYRLIDKYELGKTVAQP
jgi:DNA-binding NtrC family response regulator